MNFPVLDCHVVKIKKSGIPKSFLSFVTLVFYIPITLLFLLKVQMCRFIRIFSLSYLCFFAKFEENIIIIMGTTCTKLLKPTPYSCYELGHTWNPSCTGSSVEVGLTCLEEAVKIYSSVYFVSCQKIIMIVV